MAGLEDERCDDDVAEEEDEEGARNDAEEEAEVVTRESECDGETREGPGDEDNAGAELGEAKEFRNAPEAIVPSHRARFLCFHVVEIPRLHFRREREKRKRSADAEGAIN